MICKLMVVGCSHTHVRETRPFCLSVSETRIFGKGVPVGEGDRLKTIVAFNVLIGALRTYLCDLH